MKRGDIDEARKAWRDQVAAISAVPSPRRPVKRTAERLRYYQDCELADEFFFKVVTPVWKHALRLPESMAPRQVMSAMHISPTMRLMLHFFGAAVLMLGPKRAPRITCWPPLVAKDRLSFLRAVPKKDIASIIGKTITSVDNAIACFRGQKGKLGTELFDKRLVFPAPLATGIMMDGAFEMQLSLPFVQTFVYDIDHYNAQTLLAANQRIGTGATWTQAKEWASAALSEKHGVQSVRVIREAIRRQNEGVPAVAANG